MRHVICFHNPEETNGYLSNWYLSRFTVGGRDFSSLEQYMMFCKAEKFHDLEAAGKIMATDNAGKIKALGRGIQNYDDRLWNGTRQIIVYNGLLAKFQDEGLKDRLLETGDALLAECAVQDRIWGIGLSMKDERRYDPDQWQGQNLLGFALMEVREKLRAEL